MTVGKQALELLKGAKLLDYSAHEQMQEMLTDYDKNLMESIERGCSQFDGDFFIEVITKKEKLLKNILRNYFIPRSTCPTPTYDQTVYKYNLKDEFPEFLWVLPSQETYKMMQERFLEISPEEQDLLGFVLADSNGDLLRKCKQLNGEDIQVTYEKVLVMHEEQ